MRCPACQHENRDGAKFCEECAAPLKRACASCGSELRPSAKFCDECGTPVAASGAGSSHGATGTAQRAEGERSSRKVVTILFADLVGSTALHERLDPESVRSFMESYYAAMRGAVDAHGGRVTQVMGDGVKAVFGAPRVAEDDAIRAVRAGVEMQRAFRTLAEQQSDRVGKTGLRVAVNTGEVVTDDDTEIIGDPVNVAARLQEQGKDGDVVIGGSTQRLVAALVTLAPLGSFALKGRSEAVKAYRVESLEPPAGATTAAFVGREAELARIRAVYDTATAKPAASLALLLGSPGLGKSRLIDEFERRLEDAASVVTAHCEASGGATFAPLAVALRRHLQIEDGASPETLRAAVEALLPGADAERARIAAGVAALLAGSPASPEETFFLVRRLFAGLGATRPVVLVIDDLQWAEPLLLDLVEHLMQWGSGVPLLVLLGARPELRDLRSSLTVPGGLVADVVTLAGLDAGAATRLAANVIGAADLPASVAAKLLATSEGNPLFVSELVRMLVAEGVLQRQGEHWTIGASLAELEIPPTIQALLAARIERMRPEERGVLERAAVIGRHFSRNAVAALLAPRDVAELDARLEALRRGELIERDSGWFLGEPVLRFHHSLIRDAAYRRLLKGTRAELHARFADWIEARAGDAVEHDETIGWHLEQAHQHLLELGPIDAQGRALGERAARRLAAAGRRALARDDLPVAGGLLGRALARLDAGDPTRAELALDWCEALLSAGDVGPAAAALEVLGGYTSESERLLAWHTCFSGQLTALSAPEALHETAGAVAAAAETLATLGDAAGEAKAHHVHAQTLARLGKVGGCEAALDRALAAARRAGDDRRSNAVLAGAPLAALWGPSPVTRASGRCLDVVRVLRITQGSPAVEAVALSCQGVLEALRGRTDAARRMIAAARAMVEELGITHRLLETDFFAARIELLEGNAAAAERGLRGAYDGLRGLGLGIDAAQAAALLARALLALDRTTEAETLSHESEALAGDDLKAAIAWRGVRAEALARRGEHAAAVELAEAAVTIAAATDALLDHADARLALAAALRAAGRTREADAEERRATELWEAKGATLLAERARGAAEGVAPVAVVAGPRPESARPPRRRVRPNAATADAAALDAAVAARDPAALLVRFTEDLEVTDHTTGVVFDGQGGLRSFRALMKSKDPTCRHEPLASLGDSLALCRRSTSSSGAGREKLDFGAWDSEQIEVIEVDAQGRRRRAEIFSTDHLGNAIARLYERYAELLPDGPERARAAATARSVAVLAGSFELDRFAAVAAPELEVADARSVGTGPLHGAEEVLRAMRALLDLSEGVDWRIDDVFGVRPDLLLVRHTSLGTERVGGGAWERSLIEMWRFGPDGRITRWERFDLEHEAEALARFDALSAGHAAELPGRRPIRPNAASALGDRLGSALSTRDAAALDRVISEHIRQFHHSTGTTFEKRQFMATWRSAFKAEQLGRRFELLATLGTSLALGRESTLVEGLAEKSVESFGPSQIDDIFILEDDGQDQLSRIEIFAEDRLGNAITRLYERHAELLRDGPERARAAATAHSVAALMSAAAGDDTQGRWSSAIEFIDHRTVGLPAASGADGMQRVVGSLHELASDVVFRTDDALRLEPSAVLLRQTMSGTNRASGGVFEFAYLALVVFGADGLMHNYESFDAERETEAHARFDALVGGVTSASALPFANAATRALERGAAAIAASDWEGFGALFAPGYRNIDRRALAQLESGREQWLTAFRQMVEMTSAVSDLRMLATRGEQLVLAQMLWQGAGGDVGPSEVDWLLIVEVDERGDHVAGINFDPGDLDAAYAELDARWQAGEARAHPRASAFVGAFRQAFAGRDWDAMTALCAATLVAEDHRMVGWGTVQGPAEWVPTLKALVDLSPDVRFRLDHLRTTEHGVFFENTWLGTRDGGAFEIPVLAVIGLDEQGRQARLDLYDVDKHDAARARFEALCGERE